MKTYAFCGLSATRKVGPLIVATPTQSVFAKPVNNVAGFGTSYISNSPDIYPTAIAISNVFGSPDVQLSAPPDQGVDPSSITATNAFGLPVVTGAALLSTGIGSGGYSGDTYKAGSDDAGQRGRSAQRIRG